MSFSIVFSVGKYGGFEVFNGDALKRIVVGWFALSIIVPEFDEIFNDLIQRKEQIQEGEGDPVIP